MRADFAITSIETMPHQPNPFSTRFVRPGAIPFHFPENQSADSLVETLRDHHWLGEIIGPHGTGKSTLLETLIPALESAGRRVIHLKLTASAPKLTIAQCFGNQWNRQTQVIVDGYEQLGVLARATLAARRRLSGAGMLITAHQSCDFPRLYSTAVDEHLAKALVEHLVANTDAHFTPQQIATALQTSGGNFRDALFRLYDLYESRNG